MPRYEVELEVISPIVTTVFVDADDTENAEELAKENYLRDNPHVEEDDVYVIVAEELT